MSHGETEHPRLQPYCKHPSLSSLLNADECKLLTFFTSSRGVRSLPPLVLCVQNILAAALLARLIESNILLIVFVYIAVFSPCALGIRGFIQV